MSIIRGPRPETKFYTLDKCISEDARLSWASRGLLIFLLGKPDNWEVSVKHLINQTKDVIGNKTGRDGVRSILKELEAAGYLTVDRARNDTGAFSGMAYTVCERPMDVSGSPRTDEPAVVPQTANPAPAVPAPAKPAPANPPLIKNDLEQLPEEAVKTELELAEGLPAAPSTPHALVLLEVEIPRLPADMPRGPSDGSKTYKAWVNYAIAYRNRYDIWPVWNARAGGQLANLVSRLGVDDAPKVAAFYVCINDAKLIRDCHSLNLLLSGAEAYRTQWLTNRQMNSTTAQQLERKQANLSAGQEAAARIMERAGGQQNEFM